MPSVDSRPQGGRRICMVVYAFYENDTRVMQYADALVERGDRVDVIALRRSDALPEYEVLRGVHVHRIQSRTVNEKGILRVRIAHSALYAGCRLAPAPSSSPAQLRSDPRP